MAMWSAEEAVKFANAFVSEEVEWVHATKLTKRTRITRKRLCAMGYLLPRTTHGNPFKVDVVSDEKEYARVQQIHNHMAHIMGLTRHPLCDFWVSEFRKFAVFTPRGAKRYGHNRDAQLALMLPGDLKSTMKYEDICQSSNAALTFAWIDSIFPQMKCDQEAKVTTDSSKGRTLLESSRLFLLYT
jgi:hypothetical protein